MLRCLCFKKLCLCLLLLLSLDAASISGSITIRNDDTNPDDLPAVLVAIFMLSLNEGSVVPLSKRTIFGANSVSGSYPPAFDNSSVFQISATRFSTQNTTTIWQYFASNLPAGNYSIMAFGVHDSAQTWLNFSKSQPLGFYVLDDGCAPAVYSEYVCSEIVQLSSLTQDLAGLNITLHTPRLIFDESQPYPRLVGYGNGGGKLFKLENLTVLHVRGTAFERGYAHGHLLAPQIIDMFEYFLLEDMIRSRSYYVNEFLPKVQEVITLSDQMRDGIEGLLAGMQDAQVSMMTSLGRNISAVDIMALNTYGDASAFTDTTLHSSHGHSCSQFVFWGEDTPSGNTITGRNMDGEIDVRKLTVSNFIVFAIEPSEPGLARLIHFMWPGFIGSSSGFNEFGFYLMEDAGCSPPGPPPNGLPLLRDVQISLLMTQNLSSPSWAQSVESQILSFRAATGGSCINGCLFMFAAPHSFNSSQGWGFVYEGDRYGGQIRFPAQVAPTTKFGVMSTNHYWAYKVNPYTPENCNGVASSFSSLWRYEAGKNHVEGMMRGAGGLSVDVEQMKSLLRTVSHGTTEHSVIFLPDEMIFEVSVAKENGMWDAAYGTSWTRLRFDDVFAAGPPSASGGARAQKKHNLHHGQSSLDVHN